MKDKLMGYNN